MSRLPGDAAGVALLAASWDDRAAQVRAAVPGLDRSVAVLEWQGSARAAFDERMSTVRSEVLDAATAFATVGAVLAGYAQTLARYEVEAEAAAVAEARARADLATGSAPPGGAGLLAGLLAVGRARAGRQAIAAAAEAAAADAARQIAAALRGVTDKAEDDAVRADASVPEGVLEDGSWEPDDVTQGSIGSCYLLSSVMGLLRTDDGDALLRDGVRWDPDRQGYWVTLYPDGEAQEYFVDAVYGQGVTDATTSSGVGVASLYEAAVGQHLGYADLNDGGYPEDAMRLVTGRDARSYTTGSTWWNPFDHEFGQSREDIADALAGGAAVTADTGGRSSAEDLEVQVASGSGTTQRTVTVAGSHAYMVERIDDDGGVWVRNPWGAGNSYDDGVAFRLSPEQFAEVFGRVSVSEEP